MSDMSNLSNVLDAIVDDVQSGSPETTEFEAAFAAIRLNLSVCLEQLALYGMTGEDFRNDQLYGLCKGLAETIEWMLAKELAHAAVRDIEAL